MNDRRRPAAFELDDIELVEATVREAHDGLRDPSAAGGWAGEPDEGDADAVLAPLPVPQARTGIRWLRLLGVGLGGLISIAAGYALQQLIADLLDRFPVIGWIALGCAVLTLLGLIGLLASEFVMVSRIARIERMRAEAAAAVLADDRKAALAVLNAFIALYEERPETARGRAALAAHMVEVIDGRDLIALAEREVLAPLDRRAIALIVASAKRVSVVTALSPRALVDILYVAIEAAGLVRRLAVVYGGRPGTLGFFRVFRHAVAHLAVTGGMAAGDSLIQEVVGQSLASRLSARLGEGVVNGLMTARLGLAAMDVVRPLPFVGERRPRVGDVVGELARLAPNGADGKTRDDRAARRG